MWRRYAGLPGWADTHLTILGTDGLVEVRKNVDLAGRSGGTHVHVADQEGVRYIDCGAVELPYGRQLVHDALHRTETAMSQAHCVLAPGLALPAQQQARTVTGA